MDFRQLKKSLLTEAVHHSATGAAALLLELAEATDQLEACKSDVRQPAAAHGGLLTRCGSCTATYDAPAPSAFPYLWEMPLSPPHPPSSLQKSLMKKLNEFQQFPEQRDLLVVLARADMIGPEQITDAEVKTALEAALGRKGAQHLPATGQ